MIPPRPWTYVYEHDGGYDHMSPGFRISDANGVNFMTLDVDDFMDYLDDEYEQAPYAPDKKAHQMAEAVAQMLCSMTGYTSSHANGGAVYHDAEGRALDWFAPAEVQE